MIVNVGLVSNYCFKDFYYYHKLKTVAVVSRINISKNAVIFDIDFFYRNFEKVQLNDLSFELVVSI
jgi:hypothetical protein